MVFGVASKCWEGDVGEGGGGESYGNQTLTGLKVRWANKALRVASCWRVVGGGGVGC